MPTELTFPAGSQQGDLECIEIDIVDDTAVENYETFYVELSTSDMNVQLLSYCHRTSVSIYDTDGESMVYYYSLSIDIYVIVASCQTSQCMYYYR